MVSLEANFALRELGAVQSRLPENGAASVNRGPQMVHHRFEVVARAQPRAIAAVFQDDFITYGELSERSSRLAQWLVKNGVGRNVAVGVCVKPSLEILIALLAIWKAGGIYFPIDPTHPEFLIKGMLQEVAPAVVLTTSSLSLLVAGYPALCFDSEWGRVSDYPPEVPASGLRPEDAAYLIYTSGTTGKPKGVVATHANVIHYIGSASAMYGFEGRDVFSSLARYTFSISLFELLSPICCGGQLRLLDRNDVLTPERLVSAIDEVTVMHAGPSLLGSLFRHLRSTGANATTFPRMRHASSGGDIVSPLIMEEMKHFFPNAELYVIYGCTEISCMGTTFAIPRDVQLSRAFIGKPFANVSLKVLGTDRQSVPTGDVGEIAISGNGIVHGYLERPELTRERFVELEGSRCYLTGDMGRVHPDGNVEILGRRDFQVQIRGIRVELVGIETTIMALQLATQCAVLAAPADDGEARLIAFVVKPNIADAATFRRLVGERLPDYMLPHHVVVLDALPLTANGKLDRNQLLALPWQKHLMPSGPTTSKDLPANAMEQEIAAVFTEVLRRSDLGVNENFFDLGGDSLLAVITLEAITKRTGIALAPHLLFEHGTVRDLARHSQDSSTTESRPVLLNGDSRHPALFMLSGHHIYRQLANHLRGHWSAYGVFAPFELAALDSIVPDERSVEELASDYLKIIRRQQPSGPYCILGYSFSGLVAYELAHQIQSSGEQVGYLALVDAVLPEWALGWRFRLRQLGRLRTANPQHVWSFLVRRLSETVGHTSRDDFLRYKADERLGPLELRREALNGAAAAQYLANIQPYAGRARIVVSGERLRADPLKSPNCGWGEHIRDIHIARVETDHFRMMSDEPYVSDLARILSRDLETCSEQVRRMGNGL